MKLLIETLIETWQESYLLYRKAINKNWHLLFLAIFIIKCLSDNNNLLNIYFSSIFISILSVISLFICKLYLEFIVFYKLFSVSEGYNDRSIKDSIRFVNKKFIYNTCIVFLVYLIASKTLLVPYFVYFAFISKYIKLSNMSINILGQIMNVFVFMPLVLLPLSLLLYNKKWLSLLKGNWIKTILIMYLPFILGDLISGYGGSVVGILIGNALYTISLPLVFVHTKNLFGSYLKRIGEVV